MKLHIYLIQVIVAFLMIVVFPVYFAHSSELQQIQNATSKTDVVIKKYKFIPQEVTVKPGSTVRWTNQEKRQYHNVWFVQLGEEEPDYLFPEDSYERTFSQKGSYPYRCGPHPEMTGIVHVK